MALPVVRSLPSNISCDSPVAFQTYLMSRRLTKNVVGQRFGPLGEDTELRTSCRRLRTMRSINGSSDAKRYRHRYKPQRVLGRTDGFYGIHATSTLRRISGDRPLLKPRRPSISRVYRDNTEPNLLVACRGEFISMARCDVEGRSTSNRRVGRFSSRSGYSE